MRCEEGILLRIFIGEEDKYRDKPLYKYITELCRERGIAGVTVFRGILGYGRSSRIHKERILRLSSDLPIVIEIVDCEDKIKTVLKELKGIVEGGLITLEKVKVIRYN